MQPTIERYLQPFAAQWGLSLATLDTYWADLQNSRNFLAALNGAIRGVPEFAGVEFQHVHELRVYRCMLYLFTRATRPETFVETGVHNGFGSAFILLGMDHNQRGTLYSIDLPPVESRILAQGNRPMPDGKISGWLIPPDLRSRHQLLLGSAQVLLPQVLAERGSVDAFLHDSDHCYSHMVFEMALAWLYLRPGGWLLCDNVEQNTAFADFAHGVECTPFVAASFDSPERVWRHGLMQKPLDSGPAG